MTLTPLDPTKPSFADLPGELRNHIYACVAASIPITTTLSMADEKLIPRIGIQSLTKCDFRPFIGIHPQIDREFRSLFLSTPRIYHFRHADTHYGTRAAARFIKTWAFRSIIRNKCPQIFIHFQLPWPKLNISYNSMVAAKAQSYIKKGIEQYISKERARLQAGGEVVACPVTKMRHGLEHNHVPDYLARTFFDAGGEGSLGGEIGGDAVACGSQPIQRSGDGEFVGGDSG